MKTWLVVRAVVVLFLLAPPSYATPVEITSGNMDGFPLHDLAFRILTDELLLLGATSFSPFILDEVATGHLSRIIPVYMVNGEIQLDPSLMSLEFDFDVPLTLPDPFTLPQTFEDFAPGTFAESRFTMTGLWEGIDFVGQGTFRIGWLPQSSGWFPGPYVYATFDVPEPFVIELIGLVLGAMLVGAFVHRCSRRFGSG